MKKQLNSIQSTKATKIQQQQSVDSSSYKQQKFNYNKSINKLFQILKNKIKLRSFLVKRDIEEIYNDQKCKKLLSKVLRLENEEDLWQIIVGDNGIIMNNKNYDDDENNDTTYTYTTPQPLNYHNKIHQNQQIAFLVKLVLSLDTLRKQSASNSQLKLFQTLKSAIQHLQSQIKQYQLFIRNKKYSNKLLIHNKQKQQRKSNFQQYQQYIKQNLKSKHIQTKKFFSQTALAQTINTTQKFQKNKSSHISKLKPSKLLSQAKDISLRVKLSPYANQLKRSYDYQTLSKTLSKTIDLDMTRKINMINQMKNKQKEKLNRSFKKRYSVMEDRMQEEKNIIEKQLNQNKSKLIKNQKIKQWHMYQNKYKIQQQRINSLQKGFNAYNIHSDTLQIRKIIRNHKQSIQFNNQIQQVANLSNLSHSHNCRPYATINSILSKQKQQKNSQYRQLQHQNKILRKFNNNNNNQNEQEYDIDDQLFNFHLRKKKINRENSLVALYDNQMNQIKKDQ